MYAPSAQYGSRLRYVRIARVRARAYEHLAHFLLGKLRERLDVVWLVRTGGERLKLVEIYMNFAVVFGAGVSRQLDKIFFSVLFSHKAEHLPVRRENRRSGPHLRTHVRDRRALRHLQRFNSWPCVLIDAAETALDALAAQHLEDNLFCVDAGLQPSREKNFDYPGHCQTHRQAGHRGRHVHAADADAEHPERPAVRRVAVPAHAKRPRLAEARHVHGVADAVAGAREIDAVFTRRGLQINVVVRRHVVHVEQIVVEIADAALGAHAFKPDGLKGQIGHNGVDVVCQSLVHRDKQLFTRYHAPSDEM